MLIYFAGPLFSQAEKQFNLSLTEKLEKKGFQVFLPQRDGVENSKSCHKDLSKEERRKILFNLDKEKILQSDIFLFILDGRVPDEGACVELGIAYTQKELMKKKKLLIGLMTDIRAAFIGGKLNPMIKVALDKIAESEEELFTTLSSYK